MSGNHPIADPRRCRNQDICNSDFRPKIEGFERRREPRMSRVESPQPTLSRPSARLLKSRSLMQHRPNLSRMELMRLKPRFGDAAPTYYTSKTPGRSLWRPEGKSRRHIWVYSRPTRQLEYASTWPLPVATTVMPSPSGAMNISWFASGPAGSISKVPVQSALTV